MSQRAAIRRRKQWKHGFKNLAPLVRPHYKKPSVAKQAKRLQLLIEKQKRMQQGKSKKG